MATNYSAAQANANVPPKYLHAGAIVRSASFALSAALVVNDVIQMFKLPAGATVHEVILASDDLDTNGTPTIKLDVGDATAANRFISQSTVGQAGGVGRTDQAGGVGYKYSADTMLQVKVNTAPATGATTGNVTLTVAYSMDA
jgi:hypothetical protein